MDANVAHPFNLGNDKQAGLGTTSAGRAQQLAAIGLGLIVLLGAFLRFYNLGAYSVGNGYYAATVQSMLMSWHNFFFAAFEPGGSITVDKPPLGFWIQATSAYFLGVNGFALALPQALAGVLSIPLVYHLVNQTFGRMAGLMAALVLATSPITIAAERNNTIDGLLLFVLLLATWAFVRAVRTGRLFDLLLGAFLIGLGFNIKMLQAVMPLPALYLFYWLGASHSRLTRAGHLIMASILLTVVSLSWAVVVDLTPPENRPFIGSSENNTVMELIVGHNGLRRLGLMGRGPGPGPGGDGPPPHSPALNGQPPQFGQAPPPQDGGKRPPPGGGPQAEVGSPAPWRLFTAPLVTEAGWLLPLALPGVVLIVMTLGWQSPFNQKQSQVILWAGWLLPELLYFSLNPGLFHAYYLIMLGPPLAAIVGLTSWATWQRFQTASRWRIVPLLTGLTVVFQLFTLRQYPQYVSIVAGVAAGLWGLGLVWVMLRRASGSKWAMKIAFGLMFGATMMAPTLWAGLTAFNHTPDVNLPRSGPSMGQRPADWGMMSTQQQIILDYLVAHRNTETYLVATTNAPEASPYILATKQPVLTFGGFMGQDNVIDAAQLADLVGQADLRFILIGGRFAQEKPELHQWVDEHCASVALAGLEDADSSINPSAPPHSPDKATTLFDCQP